MPLHEQAHHDAESTKALGGVWSAAAVAVYVAGWPAIHTSTGLSFLFFCLVFSAHLHIHLPFNLHVDSAVDCLLSTELAYRAGLPVSPLKARMNASMFAAK